jgi:hypothetical protein
MIARLRSVFEEARMTITPPSQDNGSASRVTLQFPERRELVWGSEESVMASWQIGDVVVLRHATWRVVGRAEESGSLTLTLGPAD